MDKKESIEEKMERVLSEKIDEFASVCIDSDDASPAADALNKTAEAYAKVKQEQREPKENGIKIFGIIATALTAVGGFAGIVLKCMSDQKISDSQLNYLDHQHRRAYDFEEHGHSAHLVTSPTAREVLKERPTKFKN